MLVPCDGVIKQFISRTSIIPQYGEEVAGRPSNQAKPQIGIHANAERDVQEMGV